MAKGHEGTGGSIKDINNMIDAYANLNTATVNGIPMSGKQQVQLSKDEIKKLSTSLEIASTKSTPDKLAVQQKLYQFKLQELALDQKMEEEGETNAGKLADIRFRSEERRVGQKCRS